MTTEFTGVVLAGGNSTRMGRDKAQLNWQGKTWLEHMVTLLKQAGAQDVLVSCNTPTAFTQLTDVYPQAGPLAGFHAAMAYTTSPLLIVPVDIPMVTAEQLAVLTSSKASADVTIFNQSPLPCFLRHTREHLAEIDAILSSGERSKAIWHFFDALRVNAVPSDAVIANFNSPVDLERFS